MPSAISNASLLLYLYRITALDWLSRLCSEIWGPRAVVDELPEGQRRGHDVPQLEAVSWLRIIAPREIPAEWLVFDLGAGELAALGLALEYRDRVVLAGQRQRMQRGFSLRPLYAILCQGRVGRWIIPKNLVPGLFRGYSSSVT